MKLELREINKILESLLNKDLEEVSVELDDFERQIEQGRMGKKTEVFEFSNELYIKMVTVSDSYGTINGIESIAFVKPVKKEVTIYENV